MASTSTSDGASEVLGFKPTALIDEVFNIVRFSARAPSRLAKPWCPLVLSAPEAVILTVAAGAQTAPQASNKVLMPWRKHCGSIRSSGSSPRSSARCAAAAVRCKAFHLS